MTPLLAILVLGSIVVCSLVLGYMIGTHDARAAFVDLFNEEMRLGRLTILQVHDYIGRLWAND